MKAHDVSGIDGGELWTQKHALQQLAAPHYAVRQQKTGTKHEHQALEDIKMSKCAQTLNYHPSIACSRTMLRIGVIQKGDLLDGTGKSVQPSTFMVPTAQLAIIEYSFHSATKFVLQHDEGPQPAADLLHAQSAQLR